MWWWKPWLSTFQALCVCYSCQLSSRSLTSFGGLRFAYSLSWGHKVSKVLLTNSFMEAPKRSFIWGTKSWPRPWNYQITYYPELNPMFTLGPSFMVNTNLNNLRKKALAIELLVLFIISSTNLYMCREKFPFLVWSEASINSHWTWSDQRDTEWQRRWRISKKRFNIFCEKDFRGRAYISSRWKMV